MRKKSRSSRASPVVALVLATIGAVVAWPWTPPAIAEDGGGGGGSAGGGGGGGVGGGGGGAGGGGGGRGGDDSGHSPGVGAASPAPAAGAAAVGDPAYHAAGRSGRSSAPSEQDSARDAMLRGWVLPLEDVLVNVRRSVPGDVLKVSLGREDGGAWIYALRLLTPEGRYRDVAVDAGNGQILWIKGH